MASIIKVEHLSYVYNPGMPNAVTALDDVSVAFEEGSITGLLGRNGAGKSTLMRIITAQEFPSTGTVRVHGRNPVEHDDVLRTMSFVKESQLFLQ